jgi:hypothetical protein
MTVSAKKHFTIIRKFINPEVVLSWRQTEETALIIHSVYERAMHSRLYAAGISPENPEQIQIPLMSFATAKVAYAKMIAE